MFDTKHHEVDMDKLRKGVQKLLAFGKLSTPQSKTAEKIRPASAPRSNAER